MKTIRIYTDGAARGNPGPAGLGVVIEDDQGTRLQGLCRYIGVATNNKAEYLALIEGLNAAAAWKPDRLEVFMDSQLVVEQINGRWRIKHAELQPLARQARELIKKFESVTVSYVPRVKNKGADALANRAIDEYKAAPGAR